MQCLLVLSICCCSERVNGEVISKASLAAPGLMLLVAGLIGIAFSEQAAEKLTAVAGLARGNDLYLTATAVLVCTCIRAQLNISVQYSSWRKLD